MEINLCGFCGFVVSVFPVFMRNYPNLCLPTLKLSGHNSTFFSHNEASSMEPQMKGLSRSKGRSGTEWVLLENVKLSRYDSSLCGYGLNLLIVMTRLEHDNELIIASFYAF